MAQEQQAELEEVEEEEGGEAEGTQRRKRKRLTGSQKKARKAAKLGLKSTAGGSSGGGGGADAAETTSRQPSPTYSPRSPKFQAAAQPVDVPATTSSASASVSSSLLPSNSVSTLAAAQTSDIPIPSNHGPNASGPATGAPPPPPPPPSAFRFLVPPMSTLPRQFPPPPAITPLTGTEPPLDPETPEQLLESALWSWYSESVGGRFPQFFFPSPELMLTECLDRRRRWVSDCAVSCCCRCRQVCPECRNLRRVVLSRLRDAMSQASILNDTRITRVAIPRPKRQCIYA